MVLRALGYVAAMVHSEFKGAVGVRAGEVSVDCCHSKENGSSPEIEANSSGRISTCISGSEVASRDKKSSIEGQKLRWGSQGGIGKVLHFFFFTRKISSLR